MNEANVRETKDRILDAAEALFAKQGIEATSLRQITSEAKANLASVNYHFNSKEELIRHVYLRRIRPMNQARLDRLTDLESNEASSLDNLLDAFYEPTIEMALDLKDKGLTVGQFMGRLYTEPNEAAQSIITTEMGGVARRFSAAFARHLPHLSPTEVIWRVHFSIGILAHTLAAAAKIQHLSDGRINPHDKQEVLRQMKRFARAGLTAPSLESTT
ncbi:MAG: TetR/AcrR family transcriptional regulator [Acidobacteria bacterium]|nr:TetR/AcrR family transcriptional regulator [Acidobacteriota bacterium]